MSEGEAQAWLEAQGWWTGAAGDRLRLFVGLLLDEASRQNLISEASKAAIWARHIVDSAQLMLLAPGDDGLWIDLGTGAGLPGLVVACLRDAPTELIEVRPLRATFLQRCVETIGLRHVTVRGDKVERVKGGPARVISARAFAPLDRLLASAGHLSDENTVWLLPKGRRGEMELANLSDDWQAMFHVEHSLTDPDSSIVTIRHLRRAAASRPAPAGGAPRKGRRRPS